MSQVSRETIFQGVNAVLQTSKDERGNLMEIVELQVALKKSGPQKDSRFGSSVRLKFTRKHNMEALKLGDEPYGAMSKSLTLPFKESEALKNLYKSKRLARNLSRSLSRNISRKYGTILATQSLMNQIPRSLSLGLNQLGNLPNLALSKKDSTVERMDAVSVAYKSKMRKTFRLSVAVGHDGMPPEELANQLYVSINFLVSLLKKNWQNVRSLHIKSAAGSPEKLY